MTGLSLDTEDTFETPMTRRDNPHRAYITIIEGCDKACAYCVVPYTRGPERSRTAKSVIDEARQLAAMGYTEIQLLGQNVNAWTDADGRGLDALIRELDRLPALERIRYTTSHPNDMTQGLIDAHRDVESLMPFLHLPVQAGSDRVLKLAGTVMVGGFGGGGRRVGGDGGLVRRSLLRSSFPLRVEVLSPLGALAVALLHAPPPNKPPLHVLPCACLPRCSPRLSFGLPSLGGKRPRKQPSSGRGPPQRDPLFSFACFCLAPSSSLSFRSGTPQRPACGERAPLALLWLGGFGGPRAKKKKKN